MESVAEFEGVRGARRGCQHWFALRATAEKLEGLTPRKTQKEPAMAAKTLLRGRSNLAGQTFWSAIVSRSSNIWKR
jgi:hypothetical protein